MISEGLIESRAGAPGGEQTEDWPTCGSHRCCTGRSLKYGAQSLSLCVGQGNVLNSMASSYPKRPSSRYLGAYYFSSIRRTAPSTRPSLSASSV